MTPDRIELMAQLQKATLLNAEILELKSVVAAYRSASIPLSEHVKIVERLKEEIFKLKRASFSPFVK